MRHYRFLKLLIVAWLASMFLDLPFPDPLTPFQSLGAALGLAGITWLFIRRRPPQGFRLWSKPTFAMLLAVAMASIGGDYGDLRDAGHSAGDAFLQSHLGLSGVMMALSLAGLWFAPSYRQNTDEAPQQ